MFRSAKEIAYMGITVALLIGGQMAFSAISGIEIVTALFALYCLVFGVVRGVFVATIFSIIRCFVFGFNPQVIVLYLIYYNLFALIIGFLGVLVNGRNVILQTVLLTVVAVFLTCCFTMIDNALNIYLFSIPESVWKIYIEASIPVMLRQAICAAVTVPILFYPLYRVFKRVKSSLDSKRR